MKMLAVTLAACVFAAPVLAASQDLAPAVKRKPAATAPATPQQGAATSAAPAAPQQGATASTAPAAPQQGAATSTAPAAPQQNAMASTAPTAPKRSAATSRAPAAPQPAARSMSERDSYLALTAGAEQAGDALATSLIRVMSRLVAAGRCGEAASLASRDGRKELASRAQQLCK
jgi:hypothetical protein